MRQYKFLVFASLAFVAASTDAQTLDVCTGSVVTAYKASAEAMTYSAGGSELTIGGKTFRVADIDSMVVTTASVSDNTVSVAYAGNTARVVVAGNIAPYITASVSGANVAICQSADVSEEISYTLAGTSSNGSFYMDGKLKATIILNGLSLASQDSAAINIRDGKRIAVELADGTVNTLSDASSGSQKGCFMVKGHTEFKGGGTLALKGNTKHAFWGGEYVELKKSVGSITITSAVGDGMNINQYFHQKGGTLTISGVGDDGIQVSATDDETDEYNGQAIIVGGTLNIATTATASKGLKCDSTLTISGGTIDITTSGGGQYDSDDADVSACAALKAGTDAIVAGGSLTLKSTGAGGKGLSADGTISITGGTIAATTTGRQYSYSRLTASPKGIKADGDLSISGGTISISTTGGEGAEGIESKTKVKISGGEVVVTAYDDAINASSNITVTGGKVYAYSTNNDAIDSNGTLTMGGGLVLACGTDVPEGGFDCDQSTFTVTGGTLIGIGGDNSTPSSSTTTQPVMIVSGKSLTQNAYLTLTKSGESDAIFAFKVPTSYREASVLISHADLATGSTYTLSSGASVSGGTSWQGYTDDATISGGSSLASLMLSSTVTTQGGGNNPGGGGGGPGGGGGGRH